MPTPPELKPCRTFWLGDMVWAGACAGLLGEGPATSGTDVSLTGKGSPARGQVGRACKLVRQPMWGLSCLLPVALCLF